MKEVLYDKNTAITIINTAGQPKRIVKTIVIKFTGICLSKKNKKILLAKKKVMDDIALITYLSRFCITKTPHLII
jgi:hypothetical protein